MIGLKKVMLIDDEPFNIIGISSMLKKKGIQHVSENVPEKAIEIIN
jgi:CheY-like chemotaxis protein